MLKLFASGALLALLYSQLNFTELGDRIHQLPLGLLLLAYFSSQLFSAFKWSLILKDAGLTHYLGRGFSSYFSGMLVNLLGPGTVGGDASRAILISQELRSPSRAALLTVFDRIHGLIILVLFSLLSLLLFEHKIVSGKETLLFFSAMGLLLGLAIYFLGNYLNRLYPLNSLKTLLSISAVSILSHALQITFYLIIFQAHQLEVPLETIFLFIPIVNILSALPFTFGGLGIRESSLLLFFSTYGLELESAAVAGAAWIAISFLSASLGAFFLPREVSLANTKNRWFFSEAS